MGGVRGLLKACGVIHGLSRETSMSQDLLRIVLVPSNYPLKSLR